MTERIGFGDKEKSLKVLLQGVIDGELDIVYCRDDGNYIYTTFKRKEKEEKTLDTTGL